MNSIYQLFIVNLKIVYRNTSGFFWTVVMPAGLYIALSVLPVPRFGNGLAYRDFVLPGMIAYTIMSSGIYSLAYWLTDLKARGVIKRLVVTPLKTWQLVVSLIASRIVVMFVQVLLLTLVGTFIFKAPIHPNIFTILLLVILGGGIFLLIGLLISNIATSYESAAPLTAAVGMPFAFLGNIFFPVEALPPVLKTVANILPITYLSDGLRHAYLEPFSMEAVGFDILILAIWLVALLVVTISVFRLKE
jgi:ABC-2 type transport system permease protein